MRVKAGKACFKVKVRVLVAVVHIVDDTNVLLDEVVKSSVLVIAGFFAYTDCTAKAMTSPT